MNQSRMIIGEYDLQELPKLFVFNLDFTLWPFWTNVEIDPPFTNVELDPPFQDDVIDAHGTLIGLYGDVREILKELKHSRCLIAAVSTTTAPKEAHDLLAALGIDHYFDYKEIYPGKNKSAHFSKLKQSSGINFNEMIFFEDDHELRNIRDLVQLGVTCHLVIDGMSSLELEQGLLDHISKLQSRLQSTASAHPRGCSCSIL